MSRVAVVIPVLNELAQLPRLLDRCREWMADEVILVDGGSTDGSLELLQKSGVRWLATRRGRATQMNTGASQLNSDIILFLHVDTTISSSNILAIGKAMQEPEIVGGRFDVRLSGANPAFRIIEFFINWRSRITRISTGDQAIFVRRTVFDRLGGFPDQPLMEDVEFSKRLKHAGRIKCLREKVVTSSRRWERDGILRTVILMWWLRLCYRLGADPARLKRSYADQV